jgi:hypothetical protein
MSGMVSLAYAHEQNILLLLAVQALLLPLFCGEYQCTTVLSE